MEKKSSKKQEPTLSKTPRKSRSEVEHLKGEIRELLSENKSLKRQLRQFEKRESTYDNNREEIEEILEARDEKPSKLKTCQSCAKGVYEEIELLGKIYGTCNVCGDRRKL